MMSSISCRPDFVKLVDRLDKDLMPHKRFLERVKSLHIGRTGLPKLREPGFPDPRRPGSNQKMKLEESFYANPYPGCICDRPGP